MKDTREAKRGHILQVFLVGGSSVFLVGCLLLLSQFSYPYFHTIIEMAIAAVGGAIFLIAVNSYRYSRNDFFLFLGLIYLFVSILGFVHAMTYKGVQFVQGFDANVPTQLWVASRYLLALGFLIAPLLLGRTLRYRHHYLMGLGYFILTGLILLSILWWRNFPTAFVEGQGLTVFKIASEYIVSGAFFGGILLLGRRRRYLDGGVYGSLVTALVLLIAGELFFTLYQDVYGYTNAVGHALLIASTLFSYRALVRKTLIEPFGTVFRDLHDANTRLHLLATTDELTGIDNRRHALEHIENQFNIALRFGKPFSLIMMDIDDFKRINDTYGHLVGNEVIRGFAERLKRSFRSVDIVGRYGGDEFMICPLEMTPAECEAVINKMIHSASTEPFIVGDRRIEIGLSAGICGRTNETTLDEVIQKADDRLYASKRKGKNLATL